MAAADIELSGVVNASGNAILRITPRNGQNWIVQQVSINAPNVGGGASCAVYRQDTLITPLIAQGDAAAGEPFIPVRNGFNMSVRWTGGTPGAAVSAIFLYDDGEGP